MTGEQTTDIVALLERRAKRFGRWPALRYRAKGGTLQEISWATWFEEAEAVANALRALGVTAGDRVVIFAANCPEWLVADLAILMTGAVSVPLSRGAPAAALARMLHEVGPRVIFVGRSQDLERLRKNRAGIQQSSRVVVLQPDADCDPDADVDVTAEPGTPRVEHLSDLAIRGRAILERGDGMRVLSAGVDPSAPATILYSSGQSGPARGAVVSHAALVSKLKALREVVVLPRSAGQLLVLPLHGIFGRLMAFAAIDQGATTTLYPRSRPLADALAEARPHFIAAVPSFFEALRELILTQREGPAGAPGRTTLYLTRRFVGNSARRPSRWLLGLDRGTARRFLRTRIRHLLGGRLRHLVSGGGVLDDSLSELFAFGGLPILPGYGAAETVGVAAANRPHDNHPGSVGKPLRDVELRLSPRGEVLLRGPGLFSGYLQAAAASPDAPLSISDGRDAEGWYHTGDLGLEEDGFLFLTGRREDIITLASGRTVAPALIEGALGAADPVNHALICGEGRAHVAVLLWSPEERQGEGDGLQRELQRLIHEVNKQLQRHEQIKTHRLVTRPLAVEQGELSASGDPIRSVVYRHFQEDIEALYQPGD